MPTDEALYTLVRYQMGSLDAKQGELIDKHLTELRREGMLKPSIDVRYEDWPDITDKGRQAAKDFLEELYDHYCEGNK
jgi:hypothetical protein